MLQSKISLNVATIQQASFGRKLQIAYTAGFPAVGLWYDELRDLGGEALDELRRSSLAVSEVVGVSGWTEVDRAARSIALARAEQVFETAANVGCGVVIAQAGRKATDLQQAAGAFRELCRLAAPFSVRVGLEFMGRAEQVRDVASAWEVVEAAEADNGGLALDTFYFYQGGSTVDMLQPIPADRIVLVQVSDCLEMPRYELEDRHRLYPGTGAIPLEPLLAELMAKGYDGYYSLELLNDDYWLEDPLTVAREGMRALRRLGIT